MQVENEVRVDKWLWAVRLFKTRSKAAEACKNGKVQIHDMNIKPSREIKVGETISVHFGIITKIIRVKALLINRVGAPLVPNYLEDLTPKEEYDKLDAVKSKGFEWRERGSGRPSKKDRRSISRFKSHRFTD